MQPTDRILLAVPLFHCFGQNALLNSALNVGSTLVLQRKFDPQETKRLIVNENVTQLYGVPMMFQLLQECCDPNDLASVNYCFSAAATLPIQTGNRWQDKFGMPIYEGYGLTETSPFASYNHRIRFVSGSIGTPIDGVEMKIVDTETGEDCPTGELGEIAIRGPNVMLGYWNRPDDTTASIRDGWFHSGDIGRRDDDGFFYIVDRVKDMIAVGGLKVYPAEVERVILDHEAASQVAVVGIPDEVFGEQVVAFVVPSDKTIPATNSLGVDIEHHAKAHLANYKIPRRVVLLDELPRNPSGKILKTRLREMDLSGLPGDDVSKPAQFQTTASNRSSNKNPTLRYKLSKSHSASRKDVAIAFIQESIQAIAGVEEIPDAETRFLDAGLDSLMIVELSSIVQVEVGPEKEIPATLVFDHPRICDLAKYLVEEIMPTSVTPPKPMLDKTTASSDDASELESEIAGLTEAQALEELMKELDA